MARSKLDRRTRQLFRSISGQDEMFEKSYEEELEAQRRHPVECLGMTFKSDEARREHFLEKLKLKLPELRQRSDFPIGEDEAILRLSDPPYYTACPNPFLAEFVECHGRSYDPAEPYNREPFAVDVSEGKTDPLYRAHGYHTKVPHRAIIPSILHYTKPGDIVLDGFCGSGMTGVAAQWCGTAPLAFRQILEQRWRKEGREAPEWGARRVILGDLSPAATFIAANYNIPFDLMTFSRIAAQLLKEVESEIGWMYETLHTDGKTKGRINYTVWSEVFFLSGVHRRGRVRQGEALEQEDPMRVMMEFPCPHVRCVGTEQRQSRTVLRHLSMTRPRVRLGSTIRLQACFGQLQRGQGAMTRRNWIATTFPLLISSAISNCRLKSRRTHFPSTRCTTVHDLIRRGLHTCATCSCREPLTHWRRCGGVLRDIRTRVYETRYSSLSSRRFGACLYSTAIVRRTSPK